MSREMVDKNESAVKVKEINMVKLKPKEEDEKQENCWIRRDWSCL